MHDTIQTLSKVESQWLPRGRGADVLSPDSKGPFLLDSDDIDVLEPSHPPAPEATVVDANTLRLSYHDANWRTETSEKYTIFWF